MARGTRERFRQWEERVSGMSAAAEAAIFVSDNAEKPCAICRNLLGEHSTQQLFACAKEKARLRAGGTNADR